ncbi:hypothetical protein BO71DRAFT_323295 [Aspergillus ellipticus CBS 707.79]|uniref:HAUS augmin-like complex subunit 3 N-terminal domain-containing protein n=1 Tax=Aspergillus ellipticus CBS 707.79 TaxID=1448320 RepID=A0A319DD77_9EURO|nr:hypothetical protein BO71DRAFT_323295 [Aspergillus ellipticus CBS 707.79]
MDPSSVIISALKDRHIFFKRDDIQFLGQGPGGTKTPEWLMGHIAPNNLLSHEEFILYSKLESSGALQNILTNTNVNAIRPFLDDDFRRSIQILEASTNARKRQAAVLELQCGDMSRLSQSNDGQELQRYKENARLCRKHKSWKQNIAAASSDLAHVLELALRSQSEQATAEGKRILSSLTLRLKEDDRMITQLERLCAGIELTGQDEAILNQASEQGTALAQYVSGEIQHRLDRLYMESLQESSIEIRSEPSRIEDGTLIALEEELESLYPEIEILAEMSARQEFTEPMINGISSRHGELRISIHQKLDYVLGAISDIASSTETLIRCLQDRESLCGMIEAIIAAHGSEIGDLFNGQSTAKREPPRRASVQQTLTSISPKDCTAPLSSFLSLTKLLRREGLSLKSILRSEEVDEGSAALQEKRRQLTESIHSHGIIADSPLMGLLPTDQATRLLSMCLHTDSHFETSLSSLDDRRNLSDLEDKLNKMQQGLQELDLTVLHRCDKNQEAFIKRWDSKILDD